MGSASEATEAAWQAEESDMEVEVEEWDPSGRYGRYKDVLGRGSFKIVFRAFDEVEGMEVAWNQVKVSNLPATMRNRLMREIKILGELLHPNVIRLYQSWHSGKGEEQVINFITESCSASLRGYSRKHRDVHLSAIKCWCRQILRGLNYLHTHEEPIIHRDLKSDNVFINTNSGEVKLGDLGLAAIVSHQRQHYAQSVIGTPEFMAPELYDEHYDTGVDIYAFGMVVLELITREYPYKECTNPAQIYKKVINSVKPDSLLGVREKVSGNAGEDAERFIRLCIGPLEARPTAAELLEDPFLAKVPINCDPTSRNTNNNSNKNSSNASTNSNGALSRQSSADVASITGQSKLPSTNGDNERAIQEPTPQHHPQRQNEKQQPQQAAEENKEESWQYDINLKGKLLDDQKVKLKLRITGLDGHARRCEFPFDTESDTPKDVAHELVSQLGLEERDLDGIAEEIAAEVRSCLPSWQPIENNEDTSSATALRTINDKDTEAATMKSNAAATASATSSPQRPASRPEVPTEASGQMPRRPATPDPSQASRALDMNEDVMRHLGGASTRMASGQERPPSMASEDEKVGAGRNGQVPRTSSTAAMELGRVSSERAQKFRDLEAKALSGLDSSSHKKRGSETQQLGPRR